MNNPVIRTKILKQFGEGVRVERLKVGLSQEELADLAELDRSYVGGIERGERNVSVVNIMRLAKALGVKASSFFAALDDC